MSLRAWLPTLDMSTKSWYARCFTRRTRRVLFVAQFATHSAAGSLRPAMLSFALAKMMGSLSILASLSENRGACANLATAIRHQFSTSVSSVLVIRAKKNFTRSSTVRVSWHICFAQYASSANLPYAKMPNFIVSASLLFTKLHTWSWMFASTILTRTFWFPPAAAKYRAAHRASLLSFFIFAIAPHDIRKSDVARASAHPLVSDACDNVAAQISAVRRSSPSRDCAHVCNFGTILPDLMTAAGTMASSPSASNSFRDFFASFGFLAIASF
mmetsp:Transcript_11106/g.46673  ORF Transcript_11106/g.46673 Transcript_11106/m.46673 type:complete len:271 (-) Transcript_11106:326-1138(-)